MTTRSDSTQAMFQRAAEILKINDKGSYTVPTHGLYPFQWNWDSCLTAIGQAHIDEQRAWTEVETLFAHQWDDGLVPHIVFHERDEGYFPGPDMWQVGRAVPTSGITQPPVAGFAIKRLFDTAKDKSLAMHRAQALIGKIDAWHKWFYTNRDPASTGLVALIHPWESGRDNSIDWDTALERVPTDGIAPYQRRDIQHADPTHRPTSAQYDRYIWLVEKFRSLQWDNSKLHDASPFRVVDPGFNAILIRSCADLASLAQTLGAEKIQQDNEARVNKGLAALENLWSDKHKQYLCYDRVNQAQVESASIGGLLPVLSNIPQQRLDTIAERISHLASAVNYLIPSHDPADARFDSKRYWRGPAWLIINYLIVDGLRAGGQADIAQRIENSSLELINKSGFAEYYDPITGEPCGGDSFTWTAAMVMEFLDRVA